MAIVKGKKKKKKNIILQVPRAAQDIQKGSQLPRTSQVERVRRLGEDPDGVVKTGQAVTRGRLWGLGGVRGKTEKKTEKGDMARVQTARYNGCDGFQSSDGTTDRGCRGRAGSSITWSRVRKKAYKKRVPEAKGKIST